MMLNSEQILERKVLKLENSKGKAAQVGYDLSVKEIKSYGKTAGEVNKDGTILAKRETLTPEKINGKIGWFLIPGYYEVTFWEGCKIPNNLVGMIRQRSSMLRNGSLLHSSIFDPGFETDNIGSFILITEHIFIEEDARIAQIYFHECEPVASDKLYSGQFQNDKQRK